MSYEDHVIADIRLRLLQLLAAAPEYTYPQTTLSTGLAMQYGHSLSVDRLTAELAWLDEVGLLTRLPVGHTALYTLTARGLDAAAGRARVPGIARPMPGEQLA